MGNVPGGLWIGLARQWGEPPIRPKYMQRRTFKRLKDELWEAWLRDLSANLGVSLDRDALANLGRRSWMISPGNALPISPSAEGAASRRINECHRGRPASHLYYTHRATCAKAQAAHRRGPRLLANRRLRQFRSGAVEKMTGDHPRNTGPMLSSLRCGAKTRSGKPCGSPAVSGGKRCRMHGGAPGSGAPRGNKNALKHGLYTRGAIEERRQLRALMRQSRMLIQDIE